MRLPTVSLLIATASVFLLPALVAQATPELKLTQDLRIDAVQHDLSPIDWITIAPNGTIVFSQPQDTLLRYFDSQGKPLGTFGRGGSGPGEFRIIAAHGWIRDTLWVNDPLLRRVTFISPDRRLLRSVMGLSAIRVPTAQSDTATAIPWVFPTAIFADGSTLVMPMFGQGARTPPWPGASTNQTQILHVRGDGTFIGVLATKPPNPCSVFYSLPGGGGGVGIPYCGAPRDDIAVDGRRYASAVVLEQTSQRTRYRVTVIRGPGDTAFSRVYERPSRTISRKVADSVLAAWKKRSRFPQEEEAYSKMTVPPAYPPFARILAGRDGTTWVEEFVPVHERKSRIWLVLDEQGALIGRTTIPAAVHIMVASRTGVWGTETDDDGLQHVVRFRVSR